LRGSRFSPALFASPRVAGPGALQRFGHAPLQDAARRGRGDLRPRATALLVAFALASRLAAAGEPVPLETPGAGTVAGNGNPTRAAVIPASLGAAAARERAASFFPELAQPPLDPPLTINGGFGEYRAGHFHAGLDLGTGERVGKPVHAPLSGWIGRVRTSGVGYGRSIYLQSRDGRLLQFGHLDAFAEPVASWVAAAQESSRQYDQDLWPESSRFPVRAGDVIAWTGESGAGGPHLHFEVRRGDMAYNPFRAGLGVRDATPPTITSLTLEPLDDASFVERCAAPYTVRFGARRETLRVEGRVRAVVGAYDGAGASARRIVPWSLAAEFDGRTIECRFDSLSWATDMPEGDYVFDAGRVVGERGLFLWAPPGFRPRVTVADAPAGAEAGTIVVRPGEPPRRLTLVARDAAGMRTTRVVVLRPPRGSARGPDTTRAGGRSTPVGRAERFEFASLPDGFWRVVYRGAPRGSRGVAIEIGAEGAATFPASTRGADWSVVIPVSAWESRWYVRGRDASGLAWREQAPPLVFGEDERAAEGAEGAEGAGASAGFRWSLPREARFEPGAIAQNLRPAPESAPRELAFAGIGGRLEPEALALRRPVHVVRPLAGVRDSARVGLYRHDPDGWSCLSARPAPGAQALEADSRRLGTFALFADTLAPRITALAPARTASPGPYSRWALEARLAEEGSGVDARASAFEVDGARVPSEWDAEERTLRWRPRVPPAPGRHTFTVVAADRAGNTARSPGSFVLD
jgi:murein DD-endopeptidase MepM/ murein hydrolase activator NlpD